MPDSRDDSPNMRRSQAILRMPVDYVDATLILHDGVRAEVIFFVPPSEDLTRMVTAGEAFLPLMRDAKIVIVARSAIAAIGIPAKPPGDDELPSEKQRATIKLLSGVVLEGELSWTVVEGKRRTADYLNSEASYVVLRVDRTDFVVVKAHIATVQEL